MTTNNKPTDKRSRLRKAAQDYQSTLSWYQENLDSPNAERDCDEAVAAFKREIGYREMDIIADLLGEIDELQERRKADIEQSEKIGGCEWVDWNELSRRGLMIRINSEILHPQGLAVFRDPETGLSRGALISPDGVWEYGDSLSVPVVPDEIEPDDDKTFDYVDGWNACRAAMLQRIS